VVGVAEGDDVSVVYPPALAIQVLGGVAATRGGQDVDLGGKLQRGVLAILLSARGAAIPAHRLTELVWGLDAPANPHAALQSYVSHLRRALEPERGARERAEILRSGPAGYAVHLPPGAVDLWRFEELVTASAANDDPVQIVTDLREAMDLWSGRPFADYAGEPWADTEADRATELHALALDRLFAARLEIEPPSLLIADVQAAVATEPLREERWRLLALALYRDNRQGEALAALRRARDTLVTELGVDPSPVLRELEAQLLQHAPALRGGARQQEITPLLGTRDLVDREGELAQMAATLRRVLAGQGAVLLIEGPAGIGKTRLLDEARRLAETRGRYAVSARGSQMEQSFAFGAVRQLFEPLVRAMPELLEGAAASARIVFDSDHEPHERGGDGVFAALNGLYWLTVNLAASGPILLAVDDLQWCDRASLRFFAYLAKRLDGLPIALTTTLRTGEPIQDAEFVAQIRHEASTTAVRPWPLSLGGVGDLVRQSLGEADPSFIAACHHATGGNPLLLRQVLAALQADKVRPDASQADVVTVIGSRAVANLVLSRLTHLHEDAVTVARAVAILGDNATLMAIAEFTKLGEDDAMGAITALIRSEILRDAHPVGFVHPLIREAIYGDIPVVQRQTMHDRAAHALEDAHARPERVAAHLLHVPPRGDWWTVAMLRRAAAVAHERGSPESATTYLSRALEEPPPEALRAEVLLELGEVENLVDGPRAVRHLGEAYELMPKGTERDRLASVYAQALVFAGRPGDPTRFVLENLATFDAGSDAYQGLVAVGRLGGYLHSLDPQSWWELDAELRGDGPGARRLAVAKAWRLTSACEEREEAIRLCRFALADDVLRSTDTGLFWIVAANLLDMADFDLGDFWLRERDRALAEGSLMAMLSVNLWSGRHAWRAGDLREAEALLSIASEQSRAWGNVIGGAFYDAFHTSVKIERGDLRGARRVVDAAPTERYFGDGLRLLRQYECSLLVEEGRYEEALSLSLQTEAALSYVSNPAYRCWHENHAAALAGLGRTDEAIEFAAESVRRSRLWGASRALGTSLLHYGRIPGPHSEDALREAIALLERTTGATWLAQAQLALAKLLGRGAEGDGLLRMARENADASGADGVRNECDELLGGSAAAPVRALRFSMFERRIAELTVQGVDEREIAQALLLTPQSISLVMSEIRARLGTDDPAALAAVLAQHS
jgi:DNA-binding SARP family transcriptional activator